LVPVIHEADISLAPWADTQSSFAVAYAVTVIDVGAENVRAGRIRRRLEVTVEAFQRSGETLAGANVEEPVIADGQVHALERLAVSAQHPAFSGGALIAKERADAIGGVDFIALIINRDAIEVQLRCFARPEGRLDRLQGVPLVLHTNQ